ncbi:hypothetical protein FHW37_11674 [Neorhizobium alkalisoli]|uniref:Uncharacterized protein n=1 Tax=Neorhizobium alkalisoli TaxID=528178 RepID=A0A561Q149_9HYPH|nr:hypothetical protein FHW37_11674 [Neorhizobium alkalisoli]
MISSPDAVAGLRSSYVACVRSRPPQSSRKPSGAVCPPCISSPPAVLRTGDHWLSGSAPDGHATAIKMLKQRGFPCEVGLASDTETSDCNLAADAQTPHVICRSALETLEANCVFPSIAGAYPILIIKLARGIAKIHDNEMSTIDAKRPIKRKLRPLQWHQVNRVSLCCTERRWFDSSQYPENL